MTRKQMAMEFLQLAGMGKAREAFDQFIAKDFIHHNQYFKGDRESLLLAMEEASKTHPNKKLTTMFTYEEGDVVVCHSHVFREAGDVAVVHIFRFVEDKVVELWDVGMMIQKDSPNQYGAF
jgi:predicted SnoaL-like aldol condensation-catalyzing enzyme